MILLSSFGLRSPIIAEKAKNHINTDDTKVLVLPFAGFNNQITANKEIKEGLIPFGFKSENIYVCDLESPEAYKDILFDLIYVPGGNPFKLLSEVKQGKILEWISELVNGGADYFGVSSGADLACSNIEYLRCVEECDYTLGNYDALGLIKEKVLCHVDQRDMSTMQKVRDFDDRKTIFLRNDELYIIFESEGQ